MMAGIALHMGSATMDGILAGTFSWDEFVFSEPTPVQLDSIGGAAAAEHNDNGIAVGYQDSRGRILPARPKTDARLRLISGADIVTVIGRASRLVLHTACRYAEELVPAETIASVPGPEGYGLDMLPPHDRQILRSLEEGRSPAEAVALARMWRAGVESLTTPPIVVLADALKHRLPALQGGHRFYIDSWVNYTLQHVRPAIRAHILGQQEVIEDALGRPLPDGAVSRFVNNVTGLLDSPAQ